MTKEKPSNTMMRVINFTCFATTFVGTAGCFISGNESEHYRDFLSLMCIGFGATALNRIVNIPSGIGKKFEPPAIT